MLFLHGAGERGADLELVKRHGPPKLVEEGKDFPLHCGLTSVPGKLVVEFARRELGLLLDELEQELRVDRQDLPNRASGVRAYGSWHLATLMPKRFAAVVPICGGGLHFFGFPARVQVLPGTYLSGFSGAKDEVVPLRESELLVEELRKVGEMCSLRST